MAAGEAFGTVRRTHTVMREDGVEVRADEFYGDMDSFTALSELLDAELLAYLHAYVQLVGRTVEYWYAELPGEAAMIVNHAANDLLILIDAVIEGSGRTAARTARGMFEHLLHHLEIAGDQAKGKQYADHRYVTADQLARCRIGVDLLPDPERKRERRRLDSMARRARRPLARALSTYGARYRARWTAGDGVLTLAKRHGLQDEYEWYRILSAVLHGSAGALLGTRRESGVHVTHRLGPDLELVPLAFLTGITWWSALVKNLPTPPRQPAWTVDFAVATEPLLGAYPEVFRACRRLDNQLWPNGAVPKSTIAVMAVYPRGRIRWFLHDMRTNAMWPAELVSELPAWAENFPDPQTLSKVTAESGGRPMTIAVQGLEVRPIEGRRPIPAEQIVVPHDVYPPSGVPIPSFHRS